jgi:hypothetical protein
MLPSATSPQIASSRISRSADIILNSTIDNVFPLFGPVREKEWAKGWDPVILSGSGDVEEQMVFRTASGYKDEPNYTWIVSKFIPSSFLIVYSVISVDRIWFITVNCKPLGSKTQATITYTYNGFTEAAAIRNRESADRMFAEELKDWQKAINHYLATGKKLIH